jgi:RsiW-degrading membrane proteinase PrsW (M82 family)
MMEQVLVYLPTLVLSGIIVGLGLALGSAVARRVEQTLDREGAPRAALMGGLAKAAILAVVGALALWELNFGREIVLAAFLIGFGAIGVAFALAVGLGTASAIRAGWEIMLQRNKDD